MNFQVEENSHRVLMALKMNIVCIDDSVFSIMEKRLISHLLLMEAW